jgi:hypothetical protein
MAPGIMRSITECEYLQIMTRWCPDDMYGYLTKVEAGRWAVFKRGAIREDGSAAFPGKFPLSALEQLSQDMGLAARASGICWIP